MKSAVFALATALLCGVCSAAEVTVKNDSLTDNSSGAIVLGFVGGEAAASWLTSPCNGNIRAAQIFWRSASGTQAQALHNSITVFRGGTFPNPGAEAAFIGAPLLTDSVMNEFRYLDDDNTIPLDVPVTAGETFVVSFKFEFEPLAGQPSVVRDTNGITSGRNALLAAIGDDYFWFDSSALGLTGDWVIRAVIDCPVVAQNADVSVALSASVPLYTPGAALSYTVTVSNSGPAASANTSIVDIFPPGYTATSWTCTGSGGATCTSGGTGNITQVVSVPAGGQVVYAVNGNVGLGVSGLLSNSVTAIVGSPATDPSGANNTVTLSLGSIDDRLFLGDFEP